MSFSYSDLVESVADIELSKLLATLEFLYKLLY